jgi:TIR domain-containing protein
MKDVFVSYASEDRIIAQRLAMGLEASGISVWWDRQIQVGSEWDKTIEEALAAAKCVVVLWTGHAKASRWVRAEARAALKQEKIVPVLLETDAIPLAFTGIQALRFLGWEGGAESKEYDILLGVIRSKLAGKPIALPVEAATKASWLGKVAAVVGIKTLAGVVLAVLLMASSFWRIDADLAIQVQTGRIEFSVNPGLDQKRLTDSLFFDKLSLQHVGQLSFSPDQLFVANPDELDWETDTYPPKAWVALPGNGRTWQFQAAKPGVNPMVTLESREGKASHVGKLDAIVLSQPATVTLEVTDKNAMILAIRTEKGAQRIVVSGLENIEIVEEGLNLEKATHLSFSQDQELTYRALFNNPSGTITVKGNDATFILVVNPVQYAETTLFSKTALPLERVDLSWQDPKTGERTIHKKFQGTVRYPNLPDLPKVSFQAPMSLTIEDIERFEITGIRLDPDNQTFVVDMQGTAGYVKTGTRDNPQDLRPTMFDVIRFHPVWKEIRNLIEL